MTPRSRWETHHVARGSAVEDLGNLHPWCEFSAVEHRLTVCMASANPRKIQTGNQARSNFVRAAQFKAHERSLLLAVVFHTPALCDPLSSSSHLAFARGPTPMCPPGCEHVLRVRAVAGMVGWSVQGCAKIQSLRYVLSTRHTSGQYSLCSNTQSAFKSVLQRPQVLKLCQILCKLNGSWHKSKLHPVPAPCAHIPVFLTLRRRVSMLAVRFDFLAQVLLHEMAELQVDMIDTMEEESEHDH